MRNLSYRAQTSEIRPLTGRKLERKRSNRDPLRANAGYGDAHVT